MTATWSVPIPNNQSLIGEALFAQSFPLQLGANPASMLATNAVAGVIGSHKPTSVHKKSGLVE
jgi:hypothetical protein